MEKLIISGQKKPLAGSITISGAKNSALPILCASLLTNESLTINNLPYLHDIQTTLYLLKNLGLNIKLIKSNTVEIIPSTVINPHIPITTSVPLHARTSILMLGPLLAKHGFARIALPKGCAIGKRPIDLHEEALRTLGAEITIKENYICASAPSTGLKGAHYHFNKISVNATENLIMAATLAKGTTIITNAAIEPEINDLIQCLNKMGASILGTNTREITIHGVKKLTKASHTLIPDRIETGTYLVAAAMNRGHIILEKTNHKYLQTVIQKLEECGAQIIVKGNSIELNMHNKRPRAVSIVTEPYPGIPTDMQAQFTVLNTIAKGKSTVQETIFENRFQHVPELHKMSALIKVQGNKILITGQPYLNNNTIYASDLRASASLVLAALKTKGQTIIHNIHHIDRGYELFEEKLTALGATIKRVKHTKQEL